MSTFARLLGSVAATASAGRPRSTRLPGIDDEP